MRREYFLKIVLNSRTFNKIVIDSHYELKHADSINDLLILELVKTLNGRTYEFESKNSADWEIYAIDPVYLAEKAYRMIWCLHEEENYIGIINVFRR
jgi:hypothetical protein